MQLILYTLIALSFSSAYGMTSIDNLKKLDPNVLTESERDEIAVNSRAQDSITQFERIKKLSSEKTLANSYAIIDFSVEKNPPLDQRAALGKYTSGITLIQPEIVWLAASPKTVEFMRSVQKALVAVYTEAAATLTDKKLVQSTFDSAIQSKQHNNDVEKKLREIYYTYDFFKDTESVPNEVLIATRLLFPSTSSAAEDLLKKRTTQEVVATVLNTLKETPIKTVQDWITVWGKFFTDPTHYKTGILLNTVSYKMGNLKESQPIVAVAARLLMQCLDALKKDSNLKTLKEQFVYLEALQSSFLKPWWASRGEQYFTPMFTSMPIMLLILRSGTGYFLALQWPLYFPNTTIENVGELTQKALSIAQQTRLPEVIKIATFQNNLIRGMSSSLVGLSIDALKKVSADERAGKLLKILNDPQNIGGLIYYKQRTTYPLIAFADIEKIIKEILSSHENSDPTTRLALAKRICSLNHMTRSYIFSAPIIDQAREIVFVALAQSLQLLQ
jgi:hypothetical protein